MKSSSKRPRSGFAAITAYLAIVVLGTVVCAAWHRFGKPLSPAGLRMSGTVAIMRAPCTPPARMWTDHGRQRPVEDLKQIEAQHSLWLSSKGQNGAKADFSSASLWCVDLRDRNFREADFTGTNLLAADLSGADFTGAQGATDASCAPDADCATNLTGAKLEGTKLAGADLTGATLIDTDLTATVLNDESQLFDADLRGAVFEPYEPVDPPKPDLAELIYPARHLSELTYQRDPKELARLEVAFRNDGRKEQEREIIYAIQHTEAATEGGQCLSGRDQNGTPLRFSAIVSNCAEASLRRLIFDLPFKYGMDPNRPLYVISILWLVCGFLYVLIIHSRRRSAIYLIVNRDYRDGRTAARRTRIVPHSVSASHVIGRAAQTIMREIGVWRVALFFSLQSALNIGFHELELGRWLKLLTTREYDLKATGWARSLSGTQSLLSLLMLALSIWGLFGQPFAD